MVYRLLITLAIIFSASVQPLYAQEDGIQKKIDDLKERLATRVAEFKAQNKKAFYGVITEKSDGKFVLMKDTVEMPVTYDSTTKMSVKTPKGVKGESDEKMLVVGSNVVAYGTLDMEQKVLSARYIFIHDLPRVEYGAVQSVDTKEGSFVIESGEETITLDYEISTKCRMFDGDGLVTCGLSKVKPTDRVVIRMLSENAQETRGTALRILLLPTVAAPDAVTPTSIKKASPTLAEE